MDKLEFHLKWFKLRASPSMIPFLVIMTVMCTEVTAGIISLSQSSKPNAGQPVTLICEADDPSLIPPGPDSLILMGQNGQISASNTSVVNNSTRTSFIITMAEPNSEFVCKLLGADGVSVLEEKNITLDAFVLPYLETPPTVTQDDYQVATTLTVRWKDWESDGGGDGPVEYYAILYRYQSDIEGDLNYNFSANTDSNTTTSLSISGLEVDREYDFAVAVVREGVGGEGPPSNKTTMKTGCAAPTAAPAISIIRVESREIEVAWELPEQSTWNCRQIDDNVFLEWKPSSDSSFQWVYRPSVPRSYNFTSVQPCTSYDFRILFSNSVYNLSPWSEVVNATTDLIVPQPVRFVDVNYVPDSLDLFVEWGTPSIFEQCVEQYSIMITPVRMEACEKDIVAPLTRDVVVPANFTRFRFGNLTAYTTYRVSVTSRNSLSDSEARQDAQTTRSRLPGQLPPLRVADVTQRSFRLLWDPIQCEDLHGSFLDFRFRITNNDTGEVINRHTIEINDVEFVVSQVFPCRTYNVQFAVENMIGIGPYSESVTLTTLPEVSPNVENPTVTPVADDPRTLSVTWDPPIYIYCPINYYQLTYELAHKYQCEIITDRQMVERNTTMTSYNITGLLPYSSYWLYVTVYNTAGKGYANSVGLHTTSEQAPTVSVNRLTSGSPTKNSLSFGWAYPDCNEASRASRILGFAYKLVNAGNASDVITGETEHSNAQFEELSPHTRYLFQVLIQAQAGDGPYSAPVEGWTFEDVPGPPSGLRVTNKTDNSLTVVWEAPSQPNGDILHYTVRYRAQEKPYQPYFRPSGPFTLADSLRSNDSLILTVVLLEPGTKYQLRVAAITPPGEGAFVAIEAFTNIKTDTQKPQQPAIDPSRSTGTSVFIYVLSSDDTYVSSFLVAVNKMAARRKRSDVEIDGVEYGTYDQNPDAYIAAEIVKQDNDGGFIVGDGQMYGKYTNAPLGNGMYSIRVGEKSETAEAESISWSEPVVATATGIDTTPPVRTNAPMLPDKTKPPNKTKPPPPPSGGSNVGIIAAIVIGVILLVALVGGLVFYLKRRRQKIPPTVDTPMEEREKEV